MAFTVFQFDPTTGRAYPVIGDIVAAFATACVDSYTVATWLATGAGRTGRCVASGAVSRSCCGWHDRRGGNAHGDKARALNGSPADLAAFPDAPLSAGLMLVQTIDDPLY